MHIFSVPMSQQLFAWNSWTQWCILVVRFLRTRRWSKCRQRRRRHQPPQLTDGVYGSLFSFSNFSAPFLPVSLYFFDGDGWRVIGDERGGATRSRCSVAVSVLLNFSFLKFKFIALTCVSDTYTWSWTLRLKYLVGNNWRAHFGTGRAYFL